ncbi:survival of motor neuron-related-splicing factor 30 [Patella vulgata]|uniref:survival of motor neuron-related-splicing factor 30 n=1 Tax=Patella vulgata TaxID=6465 RepID=UPI00217F31B6|nr:survival of motor neuron-related-splicing factor 30 [Patella vulgata]
MAEELQENLKTYKLQLQQVEASLTTDPDNEDLQKLQSDLQEVIDLTIDLISGQMVAAEADDSTSQPEGEASSLATQHNWSVGDKCYAPYSEDGQHYEGVIEEILDNGSCTITFVEYGNTDITQINLLRPVDQDIGSGGSKSDAHDNKKNKSKKDLIAEQREYKRKKNQKKAQRMRQLEEERESEKNKWLSFNAKTFSKTSKGKVKKSIFATSDHVQGKVGVGTCGVSGRPMTTYKGGEKWRK